MDMMGGGECYEEGLVDKRKIVKGKKGFKYHWEQMSFNPITADASFAISFKFADGSKLKRAFEYHWRFWTIPEVRRCWQKPGFVRATSTGKTMMKVLTTKSTVLGSVRNKRRVMQVGFVTLLL